ncbi:uncharacterized protein AB675_8689 [Cyphellophora attinorum]|uniref:Uncharacterized protein n=1 Tax=Cyphellophora attinorum TaxID=1664694 RepID=A0A0N1HWQ1_9EURO|nr:uncharacterized protein AB675_8689 [Phialophora attinorum]KPI44714.1 hypothetical protein AB675_8689 [Phialophora attinorum]
MVAACRPLSLVLTALLLLSTSSRALAFPQLVPKAEDGLVEAPHEPEKRSPRLLLHAAPVTIDGEPATILPGLTQAGADTLDIVVKHDLNNGDDSDGSSPARITVAVAADDTGSEPGEEEVDHDNKDSPQSQHGHWPDYDRSKSTNTSDKDSDNDNDDDTSMKAKRHLAQHTKRGILKPKVKHHPLTSLLSSDTIFDTTIVPSASQENDEDWIKVQREYALQQTWRRSTRSHLNYPLHTPTSPLQRDSNFVFASLCARLYACGPSDLIKAAELMEMTRQDIWTATHDGSFFHYGTLGRPLSNEHLFCIPLLRSECFTLSHSDSIVPPSQAEYRFCTSGPVGPPRGYYDDSCIVKHNSPTIKSVFERLSINTDKYHWDAGLQGESFSAALQPGYPSPTEHNHCKRFGHVVYKGSGDRHQAPSIVLPLGHLLVTAPPVFSDEVLYDGWVDCENRDECDNCDNCDDCKNCYSYEAHEIHRRNCVPTWFTVVVDLGHVDKPLWLVRDLECVNWQSKATGIDLDGLCRKEEVTLLPDDKDASYIDKTTLQNYSHRPEYHNRMPDFAQLLKAGNVDGSQVDLIRLFPRMSDWADGRVPTSINCYTNTQPRLSYPTTTQLREAAATFQRQRVERRGRGRINLRLPGPRSWWRTTDPEGGFEWGV